MPTITPPPAAFAALFHRRAHCPHARVKPDEDGLADQEMADVQFDDLRQTRDDPRRVEVETVAGVAFETEPLGLLRRRAQPREFGLRFFRLAQRHGVAPRAGMQFHHRRLDRSRRGEDFERRLDEQRNPNAGAKKLIDIGQQAVMAADHVQPALGGAFGALFRHQTAGVRLDFQGDVEHLLGGGHFEIERRGDGGLEPRHVVVVDMAAIFAQMRGDAIGPRRERRLRRAKRIGKSAAARIAQRGDMIDVHAKAEFSGGHRRAFLNINSPLAPIPSP